MKIPLDLQRLRGGIIVSCQAYPGEPFYGSDIMVRFAKAAVEGGAVGIRANSPQDIAEIKKAVRRIPLIGLWKRDYIGSDVYITPVWSDVSTVIDAGADMVALDATRRDRPNKERLEDIVSRVKSETQCLLMADISTVEEGLYAAQLGFDCVATTLSGYTPYSPRQSEPDYALVEALAAQVQIPVIAEGRILHPEQARACFARGAYAVVVGTAITRPHVMTRKFVEHVSSPGLRESGR
ncbi:N-acetylmannosamine-6-phosphate 2-epimerase [Gordoniibacillus kamchatkensis]|uniref:Putative N-acetylmannosamine-6-phosphate 2-epimerase n=1 Tax=Gordoniibacillus kamchatkensis TaxID=1590651 RepID=A0ABR5ACC3_9BACL|nr:N-acetylmannosamine-6-phosphate 2-epimerase [Paenibacillus sp. VKM B-2647]KIL38245.1 N-acetylmannosamine-6-phosphate 2-epimerase [Paenibacillus sp. VKM B-2647]